MPSATNRPAPTTAALLRCSRQLPPNYGDRTTRRAPSLSARSSSSFRSLSPPVRSPAPLPRPAAASVGRACPVAASVDVGRTSLLYASVDTRRPGSAAVGPSLLKPATSVFAGAPTVAAAHPGSLDVASLRTHMRSDMPMPSSDVGQRRRVTPTRLDFAYC